jgi:ribosomal protein S18 acetylase RimI-like enzyme
MTIRPATPDDAPHIAPMVQKLANLHESWDAQKYPYLPSIGQRYISWLKARATDPRSVLLVAEREGKLVAFLVATVEEEIPIYRISEVGFIHDIYVEEKYRNEGIARQLVMLAIEQFRKMGMSQVRLDTAAKNEAARKLFESCGFRSSSIEMLAEI